MIFWCQNDACGQNRFFPTCTFSNDLDPYLHKDGKRYGVAKCDSIRTLWSLAFWLYKKVQTHFR